MGFGGLGGWEVLLLLLNCGVPLGLLALAFYWLNQRFNRLHQENIELRQQVQELRQQLDQIMTGD
jgi:CHASE3 domain sensor protein